MEELQNIYLDFYNTNKLIHYIINYLPLPFLMASNENEVIPENMSQYILDKVKDTSIDFNEFKQLYTDHVLKLKTERNDEEKKFLQFLMKHREKLFGEIKRFPQSIDKTKMALNALIKSHYYEDIDQVLDAFRVVEQNIEKKDIQTVVHNWRVQKEGSEKRENTTNVFWVSRDNMWEADAISRYIFREHFNIGEFESAFSEVEITFASILREEYSNFSGNLTIPYNVWLLSRSKKLPLRIKNYVDIALENIALQQKSEGFWGFVLNGGGTNYIEDNFATALCTLSLLKLSFSNQHQQQSVKGVKRLLERQNSDGYWSDPKVIDDKIVEKPSIFTTILCLESISRSGIENVEHSIELGKEWIMSQQNELGLWEEQGCPDPLLSVLIVEYFIGAFPKIKIDNHYLNMSRNFAKRSVQLSLEDNINSSQLAIISAFHGLEVFLYAVLSQPNINIKIFDDTHSTIGMRKALNKFQEYLKSAKIIKQSDVILFRNSLDRLAYLRDEIVHKGMEISIDMCKELVEDTFKFVSLHSKMIFGYDLLD